MRNIFFPHYLSGEPKLSLHHGKFNVRVFGKLYAAIQYIVSFYNSKSRNLMWIFVGIP